MYFITINNNNNKINLHIYLICQYFIFTIHFYFTIIINTNNNILYK